MLSKLIKWASAYLRLLFWKVRFGSRLKTGRKVYIGKGCILRIDPKAGIVLENGTYLSERCLLEANGEGRIQIGADTFFNTDCRLFAMEKITVGQGCMFGSNVSVYDHDHDISRGVKHAGKAFVIQPVCLDDYVWCGTNTVITKGTTIQRNCVLGAGAVAGGTLTENGLYAGVPAVRKRTIAES